MARKRLRERGRGRVRGRVRGRETVQNQNVSLPYWGGDIIGSGSARIPILSKGSSSRFARGAGDRSTRRGTHFDSHGAARFHSCAVKNKNITFVGFKSNDIRTLTYSTHEHYD